MTEEGIPHRDERWRALNKKRLPEGDQRTEGQRDRDRILYSSAFRRLAGVTQVVAPTTEIQLTHNRLTHSLKVAQVGRRIAEKLTLAADDRVKACEVGGIDPDVVEAACLAHDLGHPPFGHLGEHELNEVLRDPDYDVGLDGFEGNAQTFRIVTKLSCRSQEHYGLNLTRATLNAILKYPWTDDDRPKGKPEDKWNVYRSERQDFAEARKIHVCDPEGPSAEAIIMDLADDIAYAIHDFDDFYRAGLIDPRDFVIEDLPGSFLHQAAVRLKEKEPDRFLDQDWAIAVKQAGTYFKEGPENLPAVTGPYSGSRSQKSRLHDFTAYLADKWMAGIRIGDVETPIFIQSDVWHEINALKEITRQYVISRPALAATQHGQRRVIRTLFEQINRWIVSEQGKNPELPLHVTRLPVQLRQFLEFGLADEAIPVAKGRPEQAKKLQARAVADFIASLTEGQALHLFQELTGLRQGPVLGPWLR